MAIQVAAPTLSELTRNELRSLVEMPPAASVSIFMTMQRSGPEVRQNQVRLKNLFRKAAEQLDQMADRDPAAKSLAAEMNRLIGSVEELAREPHPGLALFVREDFFRAYKLPVEFAEELHVNHRFHVTPLVEYVQGDGRFFVLAASQKDVRLLEGNKHSIREVDVEGLPKNLVDALNVDEWVQSLQFHTEGAGGRNSIKNGGGMYFGHGGGADQSDRKSDIMLFFRQLDNALVPYFHSETAPLVFAGVDYLFPIYQSVNNYRGLVDRAVAGNPEGWSAEQLHRAAWEIVKERFDADRASAISQYGTLAAHRQASDNLFEIIESARIGKVGTLLLARGAREAGVIDRDTGEASLAEQNTLHQEDLLGYAGALTIASSGTVFLVEPGEMPTESPIAALYRY
ncbi:MAG TPA: hypothetical protein VF175_12640 [Lacipirellula sp.]